MSATISLVELDVDVAVLAVIPVVVALVLLVVAARASNPFASSASRWFAVISAVSMPASASTWWRRSSVPEARCGGFSLRIRSRPSMSA